MATEQDFAARMLVKTIPAARMDTGATGIPTLNAASGSNWEEITGLGGLVFGVWSSYIDLTGMTVAQDYSFGVQQTDIQESGQWIGDPDSFTVWDIVTDVPVDWEQALLQTDGIHLALPGMPSSQHNLENIISATGRAFAFQQNVPGLMIPLQSWSWGTNLASASDRLYVHRLISFATLANDTYFVTPPTAIVMPTVFFEEKSHAHFDRLRRSYITQGPFS